MIKFLDVDGQRIAPGDFVLYASSPGHAAPTLRYGLVTKLYQNSIGIQPLSSETYLTQDPADPRFKLSNPIRLGGGRYRVSKSGEKRVQNVKVLEGREQLPSRLDVYFDYGFIEG